MQTGSSGGAGGAGGGYARSPIVAGAMHSGNQIAAGTGGGNGGSAVVTTPNGAFATGGIVPMLSHADKVFLDVQIRTMSEILSAIPRELLDDALPYIIIDTSISWSAGKSDGFSVQSSWHDAGMKKQYFEICYVENGRQIVMTLVRDE